MPRHTTAIAATLAASLVAASVGAQAPDGAAACGPGDVRPGVEVLLRDSLHLLRGKRVGLITNHSGRDRRGTSTIDLLHRAPGVHLVALFAAEHGLRGEARAGDPIPSSTDSATGVPIHSLYGRIHAPTPEMLRDLDVLVYDIQDAGARVYTYQWTMALSAEAAGRAGKRFVVLDRPDPIRGDRVEGGVLRREHASFVGQYPVALRYGMTPGELLRYLVGVGEVRADVVVVPMCGWRRSTWMDSTGIPWTNPSPNIRSLDAAIVYPGTVFFEGTNLSEGRGTDAPFQLVGASWLDAGAVAAALNARRLPGVRFDTVTRRVEPGYEFGGETIPMVRVTVTDRNAVRPVELGAWMLREVRRRHPGEMTWKLPQMDRLAGTDELRAAVDAGDAEVHRLLARLARESEEFRRRRQPHLLYGRTTRDSSAVDTLAPGVVHTHLVRFPGGDDPAQSVHIIAIDRRASGHELVVRRALDSLAGRERTTDIVKRAESRGERVLAAVNADFFDLRTGENENNQVIGGRFLKGVPVTDSPYDTFRNAHAQLAIGADGRPYLERFVFAGTIASERRRLFGLLRDRRDFRLDGLNGIPRVPDALVLFTTAYGALPRADTLRAGALTAGVELPLVRVSGDAATGARWRVAGPPRPVGAGPIPANGAVLAGYGAARARLDSIARRGPTLDARHALAPDRGPLRMVVGGWPRVLEGGTSVADSADLLEGTFPRFSTNTHPRTAIGFSRDSATLYLVTVDGRRETAVGMTLVELADLLAATGMHDALNLDGGGSTTLVLDGRIVNQPSDRTGERPVGNAILLIERREPRRR